MSIIALIGLILGRTSGYISISSYISDYISDYIRGCIRGYIINSDAVNFSGIGATFNDRVTYNSDGQRDRL